MTQLATDAIAVGAPSRSGSVRTLIQLTLTLWAVYVLSALALAAGDGEFTGPRTLKLHLGLALDGLLPLALGVVACRLRVGGTAREGWRRGVALARQEGWFTERALGYGILVVALPLFFWAFAAWKTNVPPFTWDVPLARWDRALHAGDPFRYLIGAPGATRLIDWLYGGWSYMLLALVLWQGWCGTPWERARFWLAFLLTWVLLGTVLGSVFASAGPVYYERVTGSAGPFAPFMAYLQGMPDLHLHRGVRGLWAFHEQGRVVVGAGISAFPSLHVGIAVLAVCAAWPRPWLTGVLALFALGIFIGSVALGWHYAVDGYAAILLVPVIWWIAGRVRR